MRIKPAALKAARIDCGIKAEKLAYLLSLSTGEYLDYESGVDVNMPKKLIENISFILYCSISDIAHNYRSDDREFTIFAHMKEIYILSEKYNNDNVVYFRKNAKFVDLI